MDIRTRARACALAAIEDQKAAFMRWGVVGDFSNAYRTLDPQYEAAQLEVFQTLVRKGHIYRGLRPVYWSPSSRSALAEAELEYADNHLSKTAWIAFRLQTAGTRLRQTLETSLASKSGASDAAEEVLANLFAVIWTTTPWTLPANKVGTQLHGISFLCNIIIAWRDSSVCVFRPLRSTLLSNIVLCKPLTAQ